MTNRFRGVAGMGALLTLALTAGPSLAATTDDSLLGIRLLSSYKTVLKKYGQPQEVQIGSPSTPAQGATQNTGMARSGGMMGGPPMMGMGMTNMGAGSPMGSGRAGMMGGRMAGMPGMPGMSGMPPGMSMPGMSGGPPMMGMGQTNMGMGSRPGGLPGFSGSTMPGMPGIPGGSSMPGLPGAYGGGMGARGGAYSNNAAPQEEVGTETTWWYHDKGTGYHKSFLFNKKGEVIQIQEYGWNGGSPTSKGIGLGSSLSTIISKYGWSRNAEPNGDNVVMRYGTTRQVAFQLVKNKVVGITVGVVK